MGIRDEMTALARQLQAAGWRGQMPEGAKQWEEWQAFKEARQRAMRGGEDAREELEAWLLWLAGEPVRVIQEAGALRLSYKGQVFAEYGMDG